MTKAIALQHVLPGLRAALSNLLRQLDDHNGTVVEAAIAGLLAPHGLMPHCLSRRPAGLVLLTLRHADGFLIDGAYQAGELCFGSEGGGGYLRLLGLQLPPGVAQGVAA